MHVFGRVWIVGDEVGVECYYLALLLLLEMALLCLCLVLLLTLDGSGGSMEITFASS